MSQQLEIEIKSLLGEKKNADELRNKLIEKGGKKIGSHKQLNHYFILRDPARFMHMVLPKVPATDREKFTKILNEGKDFSVRTRDADGKVLLVVKASLDDQTSSNGVSRMEYESVIPMTLEELDKILIESGLEYQAKWSREREEYLLGDTTVCIDKNAGYGYLSEFERVIKNQNEVEKVKAELKALMEEFNIFELDQDRLERMFAHYNKNWQDYYGTDKVFNIE
jgi:predicted adenylyl cyclase CyaB